MDEAEEFISDFLAHYASQFYDPVKAHEYYLKTRELKGKRSTKDLATKPKKEAWAYAKVQIANQQKQDLAVAAQQHKAEVKALRDKAAAQRKEISDKMKALVQSLGSGNKATTKSFSEELSQRIAALPPIPKGIPKEERAKLVAQRKEQIANIRTDIGNRRAISTVEGKQGRSGLSGQGKMDRQAIVGDLKASLSKAQQTYKSLKEGLKAKYESAAQKEFDAIKTQA